MKANRVFRSDEQCVSSVLGGVLFFSLMFIFLVVIRVDFVPHWEEDKEAGRFTTMQGQLAGLKSEADRQATNRSVSEVGQAVTLGDRSTSRFFVAPPRAGTMSFSPGNAEATISAPELTIFSKNGVVAGATNEVWQSASSGVESDIGEVLHLRLRITDPDTKSSGDSVTLTITDADGAFAGSLQVYISRDPPDTLLGSKVRAADGSIVNNRVQAYHQSSGVNQFWVDGMADELRFHDVLRAAKAPFSLTLSQNNLNADYAISYQKQVGGGSVFVGGSGQTIPGFTQEYRGGRLDVEAKTTEFVAHHYHFENGAVLLHQDEGSIVRIEPSFTIDVLGSTTVIKMTLPSLMGPADSVSLPGTATVFLDGQDSAQVTGSAPAWTYRVSTSHPDAWAAFFKQTAQRGGLDIGAGEYAVATTATSATIAVYGRIADPLSSDHDLSIDLTRSRVNLRIET